MNECVETVQSFQFERAEFAQAKVEQLGSGRRFVTVQDGSQIHARLFWHHAATRIVVMCVIHLDGQTVHFPTARKMCESLSLGEGLAGAR